MKHSHQFIPRFVVLLLLSTFPAARLAAQQVSLSLENIDQDGYNEARVIGQDDNGFYVLQSNLPLDSKRDRIGFKARKLRVSYFDGLLKPKWTLPASPAKDNGSIDQVVFAFEKLLFISSADSKNQPETEIWIRETDASGRLNQPENKLVSFPVNGTSDLEKAVFISSNNQGYAMIVLKEILDNGKLILHTSLLDSMLRPVLNRNLSLNYNEKELTIEGYQLTNQGDLLFLGFLSRKDKDPSGERIRISEYHLFSVKNREEKITDHPVRSGEKSLAQAGLAIDNLHNHAVVMGFYADRNSLTGTGLFYGLLDLTGSPSFDIRTRALDGKQHQELIGERNSKNSSGISNYPVQKIILRNDGGAVIIAESAYTSEYSYYDYFTQSLIRHTEYHFDNVITVSVNRDCSIDWSAVVHKRQESVDDGGVFSSFCPLINSDEILILYNKDIDRNKSVYASVITNRGEQRELAVSTNNDHLSMLPTWGKQISENEVIIPVYQKKKLYLSKISF